MKLTVKDRLVVGALFLQEADLLTIIMQRDIKKKVAINQDEMAFLKMKNREDGPGITWEEPAAGPYVRDIEFTEAEVLHLQKMAREADSNKKVTEETVDTIQAILKE